MELCTNDEIVGSCKYYIDLNSLFDTITRILYQELSVGLPFMFEEFC